MENESCRPPLTPSLSAEVFKEYYWEKKELIAFCREAGIPSSGGKIEIADRILYFLETGKIAPLKKRLKVPKDSLNLITKDTPVIGYNNDAATRDFFISICGESFKFNSYLREFAKKDNDGSLTYGALAEGWKKSLSQKKKPIDEQFEYNRFFREYFINQENATREECIAAWKLLRSYPGKASYAHYLEIVNR